jgi:peptidoglycan hydrolase CwlO-like protein
MSDFFGKLKSGAGKVAFEAEKMARVNKAQSELGTIKRQIEAQYTKLGEMVYQQHLNPADPAPVFDELFQAIANLEQQAGAKSEEIQRMNAEAYAAPGEPAPAAPTPQAPAPAAPAAQGTGAPAQASPRFCPNCGAQLALGAKFCPDCGQKLA